MDKTKQILKLLNEYNSIVSKANELEFITTKNFIGDIIETLVCIKLKAKKSKASQKGYDAIRGNDKIQIKYRSKNKIGKYKITFKNISENNIGFDILAFCCESDLGYTIYEIKLSDFIEKTNYSKNKRVLILEEYFLNNTDSIRKIEIDRC